MELIISAKDKPKDQEFSYYLEISDKQLLTTMLCTTAVICLAIWTRKRK